MIVTREGAIEGVILREVETEEEAFYEMRRFLEINNVDVEYVEVKMEDMSQSYAPQPRPAFKLIRMHPYKFGICYEYSKFLLKFNPDSTKWSDREKVVYTPRCYDKNELMAYFDDLEQRKKVSSECR